MGSLHGAILGAIAWRRHRLWGALLGAVAGLVLWDAGLVVWVVNAAHVKNVPGRKTDVNDSAWLSKLAMQGLVRPSFIPDETLESLRMLTRLRVHTTHGCRMRLVCG